MDVGKPNAGIALMETHSHQSFIPHLEFRSLLSFTALMALVPVAF